MGEVEKVEMYAGVIVDIKTSSLDRIFHYKIPAQLESKLQIGHRVLVLWQ